MSDQWIMSLEEPWEDGERLQEPEQKRRMFQQAQATQPGGVKGSTWTLRS